MEHLKPSYTALFDVCTFNILTREAVSQEVGGVFDGLRYLKRCLQASLSLSLPAVFRLLVELALAKLDSKNAAFSFFVCVGSSL